MPRARLRWATSSSDPSSVVRRRDWSAGHRVDQLRRRADPRSAGGRPDPALEAPADDLVQALRGERVGRPAAQPLAVGQPAPGAVARGQRGRQRLERAEPRHLLDQVGLAGDVGAPEGGHGDVEAVVGVGGAELERLQDLGAALARDRRRPSRRSDARVAQADRRRRRARAADVDRAGHDPVAPHSSIISWVATAWASIACSGCSCFSKRPEASLRRPSLQRGAVDVGAVPVGGLHQHAGRGRG